MSKLSDEDRTLIVEEVIDHFKNNPSELVEAIMNWREKAQSSVVEAKFPTPMSGNPSGDVTIFEFPDYGCEPCNAVSRTIDKIASNDKGVGVVHHDLPRSGGVLAVQAANEIIAVNAIGGDWTHLRATYLNQGIQPETRLKALNDIKVQPLSLDTPTALNNIRANNELAKKTGLASQPAIVIAVGDKVQALNGNITEAMVQEAIKALRQAAKIK
jgi:protein-disulfide isomerase